MRLLQLRAENFRLFQKLSLQPHCRLNFIFGANAAGKTSLLESIYTLGRGKSFRGNSPAEIITSGSSGWWVYGRAVSADPAQPFDLGVKHDAGTGSEVRVERQPGTTLDLLKRLPVQILEPGMHRMLQDGPTYRRSFLDWGVFHVEHSFLGVWRRYRRALRQRNQALRSGADDRAVAAWEPELAEAGELLAQLRQEHLDRIQPVAVQIVQSLLMEGDWGFDLHNGWTRGLSLTEALSRHRTAERRLGLTQQGPHRAELRIRAGDHSIRNRISRGQQKLLIAALLIAQSREVAERTGRQPILLVDDFGAELAAPYQEALLRELENYPGQVFLTAFEPTGVLGATHDAAMFHVEHGVLRPLH